MRTYKGNITKLEPNQIAVCGTNTQGRSGAGFALWCVIHAGLKHGHTRGLCGNTWAIVTKDLTAPRHPSVPFNDIVAQIADMYIDARAMTNKEFLVPYKGVGRNLNYYTPAQMAYAFAAAGHIPDNMVFEEDFAKLLISAE